MLINNNVNIIQVIGIHKEWNKSKELNCGTFIGEIFNEDLIDSFDDRNRLKCFRVCAFDFCASFIYSRIVYLIFDKLAKKNT